MNGFLLAIALVSAAAALGMGGVLFVVLRRERQRSEARVMVLTDMAATGSWHFDGDAAAALPGIGMPSAGEPGRPEGADRFDDGRPLFAQQEAESRWAPRAAVAAAIAVLVLGAAAAAAWSSRSAPSSNEPIAAAPAGAAPLDLLSLRHASKEDGLTISGVVQNPHGAAALAGVTATAFLFGRDGAVLGSGRAPIDFPLLRGGDESPFVVSVAVRGDVVRYRIGFRAADGRVIAHVNRRTEDALARGNDTGAR